MSDKILFWISRDLLHFGIAKHIQDNYECESYAIIESHKKPREFFKKQDIVHFEKTWFFDDLVSYSNKKPDFKFLKDFEEKYTINLWAIAYAERHFTHYNKYYQFNSNEILSILEQECKLFVEILEEIKPQFLVIRFTDFHHLDLLYNLCKSMGIKILMLTPVNMGGRWMVSERTQIDYFQLRDSSTIPKSESFEILTEYLKKNNPRDAVNKYISKTSVSILPRKNTLKSIIRLFIPSVDDDRTRLLSHGRTRIKLLVKNILLSLKTKSRESYIDTNSIKKINSEEKFIFFPLQVQPERSTLIAAPFFENQLEIIYCIAKA